MGRNGYLMTGYGIRDTWGDHLHRECPSVHPGLPRGLRGVSPYPLRAIMTITSIPESISEDLKSMVLGSKMMILEVSKWWIWGLKSWDPGVWGCHGYGIQGCRDPETMRAYRPYALHTMVCVVGIQTTMDTITIRYILWDHMLWVSDWGSGDVQIWRPWADPETIRSWDPGVWRCSRCIWGPVQIGMQIGIGISR